MSSPSGNAGASKKNRHQDAKRQRTRLTNKGMEGLQFSTLRPSHIARGETLPASPIGITSKEQLQTLVHSPSSSTSSPSGDAGQDRSRTTLPSGSAAVPSTAAEGFDPILQDPTFVVVSQSLYWPPPTLAELKEKTGISASEDLDLYDRREEEAAAKKEKTELMKKKGELQHPRGKPPKNRVERLDDSSCSSNEEEDQ